MHRASIHCISLFLFSSSMFTSAISHSWQWCIFLHLCMWLWSIMDAGNLQRKHHPRNSACQLRTEAQRWLTWKSEKTEDGEEKELVYLYTPSWDVTQRTPMLALRSISAFQSIRSLQKEKAFLNFRACASAARNQTTGFPPQSWSCVWHRLLSSGEIMETFASVMVGTWWFYECSFKHW